MSDYWLASSTPQSRPATRKRPTVVPLTVMQGLFQLQDLWCL